MFGIYAWLYEQESQRISKRVKGTLRLTAKQGVFQGSIPPLGYFVENGKLFVRKDYTVEVVKRIFEGYISGKGFSRIANELTKEGIPTPGQIVNRKNRGLLWQDSTIKVILSNPHYTGDLVQHRETTTSVTTKKRKKVDRNKQIIVENTHEPIISKQDFEIVQKLMEERKRSRPYAKKHLFTNIAYCADCGRSMHYKANRKGYVCGNYNKHKDIICTAHFIKEENLIALLTDEIKQLFQLLNENNFNSILEKKINSMIKKDRVQLSKTIKEIESLKSEKVEALRMKVRRELSDEEYQLLLTDNNLRLTDLTSRRKIIEKSLNESSTSLNFDTLNKELNVFISTPILTPNFLHKFIERIEIKENGSPKIYYRFSDSYISSIFFQATRHTPRD